MRLLAAVLVLSCSVLSAEEYRNCWSSRNITVQESASACSPENELTPCLCSDFFRWDPLAGAGSYEIERCRSKDGEFSECQVVGTTTGKAWYFSDDRPLPLSWRKINKRIYRYRVRGASPARPPGDWSGSVMYAPTSLRYACVYPDGEVRRCPR